MFSPLPSVLAVLIAIGASAVQFPTGIQPTGARRQFQVPVPQTCSEPLPLVAVRSGGAPFEVVAGDLNGDGHPDLATANFYTDTVSILLHLGGRDYQRTDHPVGDGPLSLALGDVDGDLDLDIVSVDYLANSCTVLLQNSPGQFATHFLLPTGAGPVFAELADLDSDGDLEILVAEYATHSFRVFENLGAGAFGVGQATPTGLGPGTLVACDLDGDGDLDVAVAPGDAPGVRVHSNVGGLAFAPPTTLPTQFAMSHLEAVDLDLDGDLELLTTQNSLPTAVLGVMFNLGAGVFAPEIPHFLPEGVMLVVHGDFDRDGDPDLATHSRYQGEIALFENQAGTLTPTQILGSSYAPYGLVACDLDRDGRIDLASGSQNRSDVLIHRGRGDGTFTSTTLIPVGLYPRRLATADMDQDGDLDFVSRVSQPAPPDLLAITLTQTPSTHTTNFIPLNFGEELHCVGDINGDGIRDILTRNGLTLFWFRGHGAGTFAPRVAIALGYLASNAVLGDVDGDGDQDLVTCLTDVDSIGVSRNLGTGTFTAPTLLSVGDGPALVEVADLDGDGDLDLASADALSARVTVWRNLGAGVFGTLLVVPLPAGPVSIDSSDLDRDGHVDLVTSNGAAGTASVLFGAAGGGFTAPSTFTLEGSALLVSCVELDGDLLPEVVVVCSRINTGQFQSFHVLPNLGARNFATPLIHAAGYPLWDCMAHGDFDQDGDVDLATGNAVLDSLAIHWNKCP